MLVEVREKIEKKEKKQGDIIITETGTSIMICRDRETLNYRLVNMNNGSIWEKSCDTIEEILESYGKDTSMHYSKDDHKLILERKEREE